MKIKSKQTAKKTSKKIHPGISRTTQKTFIITAIVAYILQASGTISSFLNMQGVDWTFSRLFPAYVIDSIIIPAVLFAFAYVLFKNSPSKVSRLFKATLVPVVAIILSMTISLLIMELFKEQLGYGNTAAIWSSQWISVISMIASMAGAVAIALYVFKPAKDKEFTASRNVQKAIVGVTAVSIAANITSWISSIVSGSNGGYVNSSEALYMFALSAFAIVVPMTVLYLIATKTQTKLTRLFNAVLYLLIGAFLSGAVFSTMFMLGIYMHEPGSIGAMLYPFLGIAIWFGLIAVHKLRRAF